MHRFFFDDAHVPPGFVTCFFQVLLRSVSWDF